MKIDIFCHITPPKFLKAFEKKIPPNICRELPFTFIPSLVDLEMRFRIMDRYPEMRQVLTLTNPPIELVAEPTLAVELSQIANDEMGELVQKYPDRFVGAVACLPLNDVDAALRETDRAINDLHLRGIQIFSHIAGKPVSSLEFNPLYEKMAHYNLPIWIHPFFERVPGAIPKDQAPPEKHRMATGMPDPAVAMERGGFQLVFPSTTAMTRLVYSPVFDQFPNIKFITHHCGSAVPYFANRIQLNYDMLANRQGIDHGLKRPILDYYKMFYADTALHGNVAALMCGYHFFSAAHLLFGTDMPFDGELGAWSVRKTIESIEQMDISDSEKAKIYEKNAKDLLRL
jgi:predicted TIM-barrel fold metal-dependent hydrolase